MPFILKRRGFNKIQRGIDAGLGLQTLGKGWVSRVQIMQCRMAMDRYLQRRGTVWVRSFSFKEYRPTAQGKRSRWVATVKPGWILFHVSDVPESKAREALRLAANKIGFQTKIVSSE